jgi:hypothetical protein
VPSVRGGEALFKEARCHGTRGVIQLVMSSIAPHKGAENHAARVGFAAHSMNQAEAAKLTYVDRSRHHAAAEVSAQ